MKPKKQTGNPLAGLTQEEIKIYLLGYLPGNNSAGYSLIEKSIIKKKQIERESKCD